MNGTNGGDGMPRVHRKGHRQRGAELSREDIIIALMDSWDYPNVKSPLLATFPEQDRAAMVDEALDRFYARREREREPILKSRLLEWPVYTWGSIFAERPDLIAVLNPEQLERWDAWRAKSHPAASEKSTLRLINPKPAARAVRS
jgi:hypothetical protein